MKPGWKKALPIAMVAWMILMLVVSCKEKSSAQRQPQKSNTTQKQAEKAVEEDL